jgi:hypothetical protein
MKIESGAWGYHRATLFLGDINTGMWYSRLGVGRKIEDIVLLKIPSYEIQTRKTRWSNSRQIWQNILKKQVTTKSCFANDDGDDFPYSISVNSIMLLLF